MHHERGGAPHRAGRRPCTLPSRWARDRRRAILNDRRRWRQHQRLHAAAADRLRCRRLARPCSAQDCGGPVRRIADGAGGGNPTPHRGQPAKPEIADAYGKLGVSHRTETEPGAARRVLNQTSNTVEFRVLASQIHRWRLVTIDRLTRRRLIGGAIAAGSLGGVALGLRSIVPLHGRAPLRDDVNRPNFAAPFALSSGNGLLAVWQLDRKAEVATPSRLVLGLDGQATSPRLDVSPSTSYRLELHTSGPLTVRFLWESTGQRATVQQFVVQQSESPVGRSFAVPPAAVFLRIQLFAEHASTAVADLRLILADGIRVEPYPDFFHAALAFSFDWESAMGGLIHSRSVAAEGEGEGAVVGLTSDGSPSVEAAEDKGLRMREGSRLLAGLFAPHDIKATFYATGYNLLLGNQSGELFLGNPIYKNVDREHGWGSDFWKTHPWYMHDPRTIEAVAPAWYFGSETRFLADAGHEIGLHTFGHLYVRGVTPEQLAADLAQWQRSARALGVSPVPSFAFPWTSSNSVDNNSDYLNVFKEAGIEVLTRLYSRSVREPYGVDLLEGEPALRVFPDHYLPSTGPALAEAENSIEEALVRRGCFSLWTHPNEVVEQAGRVVWPRIVDYAAQRRERGLWVAPVYKIAAYTRDRRSVAMTALPLAGGTRITLTNQAPRVIEGLTLTMAHTIRSATTQDGATVEVRDTQLRLPPLARSETLVVQVLR